MINCVIGGETYLIGPATALDVSSIIEIYYSVYNDSYPDEELVSFYKLKHLIEEKKRYLFIAKRNDLAVAVIVFNYDHTHHLAKVYGLCCRPSYHQKNIAGVLFEKSFELISNMGPSIDVSYSTTRTVNQAAQRLTEKMGFKKLGIFPNVHKTFDYETHALAAKFSPEGLNSRFTNFKQHPDIIDWFNLVKDEVGLPEMEVQNNLPVIIHKKIEMQMLDQLEIIEAPHFINYRLNNDVRPKCFDLAFYPFISPNILFTTPDQKIEIMAHLSHVDGHCVIIGAKIEEDIGLSVILKKVAYLLREKGARYIEMITMANKVEVIDQIIKAKFLPCGYFPAFQLIGNYRYDYVVFSRSFEIFDFANVHLSGPNFEFLKLYYLAWEKNSLFDKLLKDRHEQLN